MRPDEFGILRFGHSEAGSYRRLSGKSPKCRDTGMGAYKNVTTVFIFSEVLQDRVLITAILLKIRMRGACAVGETHFATRSMYFTGNRKLQQRSHSKPFGDSGRYVLSR